jgi:hypothetical protein
MTQQDGQKKSEKYANTIRIVSAILGLLINVVQLLKLMWPYFFHH